MRRFHVHVSVQDIDESIRFYSTLFGASPSVHKNDYAKWMLEDPRVNFAISRRGAGIGINHLGLQFDTETELASHRTQLSNSSAPMREEAAAPCCYAEADKHWVTDPQGIPWEAFHTLKEIPVFGLDTGPSTPPRPERKVFKIHAAAAPCCGPATKESK
jgi:catechol 2,3-dioxygenase-like lactoylglutathione lyase family enzyme